MVRDQWIKKKIKHSAKAVEKAANEDKKIKKMCVKEQIEQMKIYMEFITQHKSRVASVPAQHTPKKCFFFLYFVGKDGKKRIN